MGNQRTLGLGLVIMVCAAGCAPEGGERGDTPLVDSAPAASRLAAIRRAMAKGAPAALPQGETGSLVRSSTGVERRRSSRAPHAAQVRLPLSASGAFSVRDQDTGLSAEMRLLGASDGGAEIAGGYVVYPGAGPGGADVLHRPTATGTEDYLYFATAPDREEARYSIELGAKVAGVRLVGSTLELVDAAGTPRLRMSPPSLVDARGERRELRVSVSGCAFDADPRGPWGRKPVAPGASSCEVVVDWHAPHNSYPILVDPTWSTTGSTVVARPLPHMHVLPDGRAFIASDGYWSDDTSSGAVDFSVRCSSTAELYDPATGTWSATASTPVYCGVTTQLPDGRVLAVGTATGVVLSPVPIAAFYDPATATWSMGNGSPVAIYNGTLHTAADGTVLLWGGFYAVPGCPNGFCTDWNKKSWRLDVAGGTWTEIVSPNPGHSPSGRVGNAVNLLDGRVLERGGDAAWGGAGGYALLWSPVTGFWTLTDSTVHIYSLGRLVRLADGKVLHIGGFYDKGLIVDLPTSVSAVEIFDPATNKWTAGPSMAVNRALHTATVLADGRVLVAGGFHYDYNNMNHQSMFWVPPPWPCEIYDPLAQTWTQVDALPTETFGAAAVLLQNGSVLQVGGDTMLPNGGFSLDVGMGQQTAYLYAAGGAGGGGAGGMGGMGTGGMGGVGGVATGGTGGVGGMATGGTGGVGGMGTGGMGGVGGVATGGTGGMSTGGTGGVGGMATGGTGGTGGTTGGTGGGGAGGTGGSGGSTTGTGASGGEGGSMSTGGDTGGMTTSSSSSTGGVEGGGGGCNGNCSTAPRSDSSRASIWAIAAAVATMRRLRRRRGSNRTT